MATKKKKRSFDRVVAIDLGNGLVKIRSIDSNGKKYLLSLPCAWAYKKDLGDKLHSKEFDLDTYTINDVEYIWGKDIAELDGSKLKVAIGHDNRYKSELYKIMAKIAMAKVAYDLDIKPTEKIYLVTGVPSGETNTLRENEIQVAFLGDKEGGNELHEVEVNNQPHLFRIAHVEVMSQPVATVIGKYLDEDGYVADDEYEKLKVGVIDIGGGTTDLDIVDCLQRQGNYTSIPKGFSDVYAPIRKLIKSKYPSHDVSDYKLLSCFDEEMKYQPNKRAEPIDFESAFEEGIQEVVMDIQQAVLSHWKDQTDMDEILLIGASAKLFEDKLSNVVGGLTIPKDHAVSNVEGYYRWGVNRVAEDDE